MAKPNPTIVAWMLNEIEADLKKLRFWREEPIDEAIIRSSRAAFCMDVMPFTDWLQSVLLPNARRILDSGQDWPKGSMVATQAIRELDGMPEAEELIDHLSKFDALFNQPLDGAGFPSWLNAPKTPEPTSRADAIHPAEPPRLALAQLPTPLLDGSRLIDPLGKKPFLIKRDDLTGLELTGNKIRKLEYLIADARAQGCDTLVTHGGFQSNHCRATAAAGARIGMRVRMFLRATEPNPPREGNLFLDHLFGANFSLHSPEEYNEHRQAIIDEILHAERAAGHKPYFFPVGASVPIGCWGYIRCMHELMTQLTPDAPIDLFVPLSSSGTLAGAILGKALFKLDRWRVIGIPVSDSVNYFQTDVRKLLDATIAQFHLGLDARATPIELLDGYIGDGYAIPYPEAIRAIRHAAETAGLLLDPTYTGKAMHAVLDSVRHNRVVRADATPVFLHTGGAFGLLARRELF